MCNTMWHMGDEFEFTTQLWQRSKSSFASTIPQPILAIKGAPTGDDAVVNWRINPDTGAVELEFDTEDDD